MNPQELAALHFLHVSSAMLLVGSTFYAFAGAPESRKKALAWGGIFALVVLLTGLRMWQGLYGFHGGWVVVKLLCWIGLSALTGLGYRRRAQARLLAVLAAVFVLVAVSMAYFRPF